MKNNIVFNLNVFENWSVRLHDSCGTDWGRSIKWKHTYFYFCQIDISLTGLHSKTAGDNLYRKVRHILSTATICASNIGMNCRRRQFMRGNNSCRNRVHPLIWGNVCAKLIKIHWKFYLSYHGYVWIVISTFIYCDLNLWPLTSKNIILSFDLDIMIWLLWSVPSKVKYTLFWQVCYQIHVCLWWPWPFISGL